MKKASVVAVALLTVAGIAQGGEPTGPPVALYITTGATADGFTDPDKERADSRKDLIEALGKKKNIRLVATKEEALLSLEVLGRGVREDSGSFSKAFGGKNEVKRVEVRLSAGAFSADLAGESAGGGFSGGPGRGAWKKASYKVADQIEKWVAENRAQLVKIAASR